MARRLTADEVAVAKRDPRYKARRQLQPKNHPKTSSEVLVDGLLTDADIVHYYEDQFFPTGFEDGVEHGFCPDFRIEAGPEWGEQWWEVTELRTRLLTPKRRKIANAAGIYDIRIVLVDQPLLARLAEDPGFVDTLLVATIPEIEALRQGRVPAAA